MLRRKLVANPDLSSLHAHQVLYRTSRVYELRSPLIHRDYDLRAII